MQLHEGESQFRRQFYYIFKRYWIILRDIKRNSVILNTHRLKSFPLIASPSMAAYIRRDVQGSCRVRRHYNMDTVYH